MQGSWWASTARPRQRRPPRGPSMKHHTRGCPLSRCMRGTTSGVFPILDMDWRKYESQGESEPERLAGWQEQYPNAHAPGDGWTGSARPQARRGIRARSAGGGRQSRSRRIRWHAAGLGRRRGGAIGKSSGGRRRHPVGRFGTLNGTCSCQPHRAAARKRAPRWFSCARSRHDADDSGEHPLLGTGLTHSPRCSWSNRCPDSAAPALAPPASSGAPPREPSRSAAYLQRATVSHAAGRRRIFAVLPMLDAVLFELVVGPAGLDQAPDAAREGKTGQSRGSP